VDFISVFNDVLGPIMRGPSSSHTAGGYRIGLLVRDLLSGEPTSVRVTFDPAGSMAPTYRPLGVDLAFTAGLMGWSMIDEGYFEARDRARDEGVTIRFEIAPVEHTDHPNGMLIEAETVEGRRLHVVAEAVGGGGVRVVRIEDWSVELDGKSSQVLVEVDAEGGAEVVELLSDPGRQVAGGSVLLTARADASADPGEASRLREHPGVTNVWAVSPVFFVRKGEALFESAEEMVTMAEERDISLGQAALDYEAELLGMTEPETIDEMLRRYEVMQQSAGAGLDDGRSDMLLLQPTAGGDALLQQPWGNLRRANRRLGRHHTGGGGEFGRGAGAVSPADGLDSFFSFGRWPHRRPQSHLCRRAGGLPGGDRRLGRHGGCCGG
jgi:L-serine dehydratase